MNSTFTCPHCGVVSNIEPAHVGKTGPCKGCGKEVTVPFPKEANLPPTASARGSTTPWLIGCALVMFVVLGLAAGVAWTSYTIHRAQRIQQDALRAEMIAREQAERAERLAKEEPPHSEHERESAVSEQEKGPAP